MPAERSSGTEDLNAFDHLERTRYAVKVVRQMMFGRVPKQVWRLVIRIEKELDAIIEKAEREGWGTREQ